jgi:hypothetical protein
VYVYVQLLFAFLLTNIQVFRALGNKRPKSLTAVEDDILSAAVKISHGEDLGTTISCLRNGLGASLHALEGDAKACDWFSLTKPTDCLSLFPQREEFDRLSLSDENPVRLASRPCSPKGFPSGLGIPYCINPQLLLLDGLSINADAPMAKGADPLYGRRAEDGDGARVEEEVQGEQGHESEEEREEEEEESGIKSTRLSNIHHINGLV